MMLRELCERETELSEDDIARLEQLESSLPLIAELTGCDIFIDCYDKSYRTVLVAAQASPRLGGSVYDDSVTGKVALREMEPAVYHALEGGLPARDLKAITQEGKSVRQDVVPVLGASGDTIGVLIKEKDVSSSLRQEKKYNKLASEQNSLAKSRLAITEGDTPDNSAAMREIHHRVKNDLQMVASIMNLQARRTESCEVKAAFRENIQRVFSIASIHDILTESAAVDSVRLLVLLRRICRHIQSIACEKKAVSVFVQGDDMEIVPDTAASIAIVANELVSNAVEHGFAEGASGMVSVTVLRGKLYSTVTVEDNGSGYDPGAKRSGSFGLDIVALTVRDKLHGEFRTSSCEKGTKAAFDFKMTPCI